VAVTQAQKVDFLLKKIGFTKTKTGLAVDESLSGTKKAGFAEAIASPLIIANDSLWNESSQIPTTPPTLAYLVICFVIDLASLSFICFILLIGQSNFQ